MRLIIIGAGAAGLMSAIAAAEAGCKDILILESNKQCGLKILISGGGRCNITNQNLSTDNYYCGNRNFVKNVFKAFDNNKAVDFFTRLGLKLNSEPSGKYFPVNDKAAGVRDALLSAIERLNIRIEYSAKVSQINFDNDEFVVHTSGLTYTSKRLILACGGKSFPSTGSDGSGYALAKMLGHKIKPVFPSLSPILLDDKIITSSSGISVDARLSLISSTDKPVHSEGSVLFTHFGLSGPAALDISRELTRLKSSRPLFLLNLLPAFNSDSLFSELKKQSSAKNPQTVYNYLREKLPQKFLSLLFSSAVIDTQKKFGSASNKELRDISALITAYNLNYTGVKDFKLAEATAGGIELEEVNFRTMESKIRKGLYFAGEILDVDGKTGGYNFQWAWSTGFIAGKSSSEL